MILNALRKRLLGMSTDTSQANGTQNYKDTKIFTELAKTLITDLDLETMSQKVVDQMIDTLGSSAGVLFMMDEDAGNVYAFTVSSSPIVHVALKALPIPFRDYKYDFINPVNYIGRSAKEKKVFVGNDLADFLAPNPSRFICKTMQSIVGAKYFVSVPLIAKDKVIGVNLITFLEETISDEKTQLIEPFNDFVAAAVYNGMVYKKTTDQNNQMTIINKFTNKIINSLEPEKIAQNALDTVPDIFGHLGALYSELVNEGKTLKLVSYTDTEISKKAFGMLDKKPTDYMIDLDNIEMQDTINVMAFKQDKIILSETLNDLARNIIPKFLNDNIQKLLGIKSIVAVPVKSKNKVVGILDFVIAGKEPKEISKLELDTMQIVANQIGIALENANLYASTKLALQEVENAYAKDKDMLDILGHELRTPATVCKGNLELINKFLTNPNDIQTMSKNYLETKVQSAYSAIMKETGLINELLTATKLDSGQLIIANEAIDILRLAKMSYQNYIDIAKKQNLELRIIEPSQPLPVTIGDNVRLGEVIDNLISNSIKYTKEGYVEVTFDYDDKNIYIHVKDTGNGIPEKDKPQLFHKFYRLNNHISESTKLVRPGGTGLGLYVSKGIVEAHGGQIWVESEGVGKGARFSFSLPIRKLDGVNINTAPDELDMFKRLGLK